jgi:hypothetical protein
MIIKIYGCPPNNHDDNDNNNDNRNNNDNNGSKRCTPVGTSLAASPPACGSR